MNIKEYDNNIIIKEKTSIEKYLLRIIQRYFDIENNYTKESIEEIILESLTRFKQFITIETGFIFSLNKKTGHLVLSIRDFDGQPRFNKKTAFNKNFGINNNTILEGNDPRLSDARMPLYHNHTISDIDGLIEALSLPNRFGSESHLHINEDTVGILRYTGTMVEIDLIFLEFLETSLKQYYENLEFHQRECKSILEHAIETINNLLLKIKQYLEIIQDMINNLESWVPKSNAYTDEVIARLKNYCDNKILDFITQEEIDLIIDLFKKLYYQRATVVAPLLDGVISCVPVIESQTIEAGSEEGEALYEIFTQGTQIKVHKLTDPPSILLPGETVPSDWGIGIWTWSDADNSFYYSYNDQDNYAMFISSNKFETYTHRVTFFSNGSDDDLISTVIAYDEETRNELSLAVVAGGFNFPGAYGTSASIMLNFKCNWSLDVYPTFGTEPNANGDCYKIIGPRANWPTLTNGVTVLIKRNKNNIKAWINYNTPNIWEPETINGIKDIYPATLPDFELNFEDHAELACFMDKKMKYGYGCHSQEKSSYRNVYAIGESFSESSDSGSVNIKESYEITSTLPSFAIAGANKIRMNMFFEYDNDDGSTVSTPLPYVFLDKNKKSVVIQATYENNGTVHVTSSFMEKVPNLYASNIGVYQNKSIIGACKYTQEVLSSLIEAGATITKIDSIDKNNFIKSLITNDNVYRIQGESLYALNPQNASEERYRFDDGTFMNYFNWGTGLKDKSLSSIAINNNGKWLSIDPLLNKYYIIEYEVSKLSNFFTNPKVRFEVLGSEE